MAQSREFYLDRAAFVQFDKDLKEFEPGLRRAYRKSLREIAEEGAAAVRRDVMLPPLNDQPGTRGAREDIASAVSVKLSFAARAANVKIVAGGAKSGGVAAPYNKKKIRHPVFGNRDVWVEREQRPYFGASITKVLRRDLQKKMSDAADAAFRAMKATKV